MEDQKKVGGKQTPAGILARKVGITVRAVNTIGMDRLVMMSEDARKILLNDRVRLSEARGVAS